MEESGNSQSDPLLSQQQAASAAANAPVEEAQTHSVNALQGGRAAFRTIVRQLTPEELSSTAASKLIVDMLETAEEERNDLREYRDKFYTANTRACVAEEASKKDVTNEVLFGVMQTMGGAILGLSALFYPTNNLMLVLTAVVGAGLVGGAAFARISR